MTKCLICKKEIKKNRKYCSTKCQNRHRYKKYIKMWLNGEKDGTRSKFYVSKHVIRYLFEKNKNKCQKCGWSKINKFTGNIPLEVHHKDGNCKNNTKKNLMLLCPNCHALTSTFRSKNKSCGRKKFQENQ